MDSKIIVSAFHLTFPLRQTTWIYFSLYNSNRYPTSISLVLSLSRRRASTTCVYVRYSGPPAFSDSVFKIMCYISGEAETVWQTLYTPRKIGLPVAFLLSYSPDVFGETHFMLKYIGFGFDWWRQWWCWLLFRVFAALTVGFWFAIGEPTATLRCGMELYFHLTHIYSNSKHNT